MKLHRPVLDIAGRFIHLESPMYGKVILHLPTQGVLTLRD
jgi:hypothetical protein